MRGKKGENGMMAIKVDLEKAYERLRWEFVMHTLKEIGFLEGFIELIEQCLASYTMQVLVNGDKFAPFEISRGIRQEDPLSPYLFMLCLERLAHLIQSMVHEKE